MDEEYDVILYSPLHDDPAVIAMNSALILDYCQFAFQQLLIFHYDHEGTATQLNVFLLLRSGPGVNSNYNPKALELPRSWKIQQGTMSP